MQNSWIKLKNFLMLICKHQIPPSLESIIYLSLGLVFFTHSSSVRDILQRILQKGRSFPQSGIMCCCCFPSNYYFSSLALCFLMLESILFYWHAKLKFTHETLKLELLGNCLQASPWHCPLPPRTPGILFIELNFQKHFETQKSDISLWSNISKPCYWKIWKYQGTWLAVGGTCDSWS